MNTFPASHAEEHAGHRARPLFHLTFALTLTACAATDAPQTQEDAPTVTASKRPHIVLVMADDMGYTDIGCYGSEIRTPTLDRLAADGVRMTQFHNAARCCPTRASLLTGLYPHQAGIGLMTGDRGHDAYRGVLSKDCITLAEALGDSGYSTYMAGKWHVTPQTRPGGPTDSWPTGRGFDRFYGTITGAGSFWDPATLCRGDSFITPENDPEYSSEGFYYTDAISDEGARFVREHLEGSENPLFLYVAYTSAHWPMHAPEEDIARYDGVYEQGYAPIRSARLERGRELGVLDPAWELSPQREPWSKNEHQAWDERNMQVYAAMVERMDAGIGRVIAELERAGELDNTLFVYLQDNGGCAEGYGRQSNESKRPVEPLEPLGVDGLQTQIWPPMQTRDGHWVRTGPEVMAGAEDTFVAYGAGWANASNTPFRGYKHDGYEGGTATPFVVHWPAGLSAAARGSVVDEPAHLIDVMPTFLAAAKADYPESRGGIAIQPAEGVDLLTAIRGTPLEDDRTFCLEHHGNQALRRGRWKIVSQYRKDAVRQWELYDLAADRTELHDLAAAQPERLGAMIADWERWATRVGVVPWPMK
ncbi:MAG: arylsulfatase A-like enzyme [Planctomycetota bacterium]|jgi:arylsulfatase A-like enzyme